MKKTTGNDCIVWYLIQRTVNTLRKKIIDIQEHISKSGRFALVETAPNFFFCFIQVDKTKIMKLIQATKTLLN